MVRELITFSQLLGRTDLTFMADSELTMRRTVDAHGSEHTINKTTNIFTWQQSCGECHRQGETTCWIIMHALGEKAWN